MKTTVDAPTGLTSYKQIRIGGFGAALSPPGITKSFATNNLLLNSQTTLTFTVTNPNGVDLSGINFTDTLPSGLQVASPNGLNPVTGCNGTVPTTTATTVSLANATLPANGSCTFSVNVVGTRVGLQTNCVTANTTLTGAGARSCANVSVVNTQPTLQPPSITKIFDKSSIPLNGPAVLTFTISNPNTAALTGVNFNDVLPAGLVISNPNGLSPVTGCNGTVPAAVAGSASISLAGATITGGGSCSFSISVTGVAAGLQTNTVTVADTTAGLGNTSTASITVVSPPSILKAFGSGSIGLNTSTTLTFTIINPNLTTALAGLQFTDTLPPGLQVSVPNGLTPVTGCNGTVPTTTPTTISLSGATLPANGSCTFSINVTGVAIGLQTNSVTVQDVIGGVIRTGNTSTAVVEVVQVGPPSIAKAFNPAAVPVGSTTTLTITVTNPNAISALPAVTFTDVLPAGLIIATPNGLATSCVGTITATAGSNSISLTNGSLPAASSCVISVTVLATAPGVFTNYVTVSDTIFGIGNTASATLTVWVTDAFHLRYFNTNYGSGRIIVSNAGTSSTGNNPVDDSSGTICANFYSFDPNEEMQTCCACPVTPNGLASLGVNEDIISKNLIVNPSNAITVKVLFTLKSAQNSGGSCDASQATLANLARGGLAWGVNLRSVTFQGSPPTTYRATTETKFTKAELSPAELTKLTTYCKYIKILGSGVTGLCASCQAGARGAIGN